MRAKGKNKSREIECIEKWLSDVHSRVRATTSRVSEREAVRAGV